MTKADETYCTIMIDAYADLLRKNLSETDVDKLHATIASTIVQFKELRDHITGKESWVKETELRV